MALHSNNKGRCGRRNILFNGVEILIYGIPIWLGSLAAGWYFKGALGFKSAALGLVILALYVAAEIYVAKKFATIRDNNKAVAFLISGFAARIIVLLIATYIIYRFTTLDLFVLLVTVVMGFTAMLLVSTKNWLNEHDLIGKG